MGKRLVFLLCFLAGNFYAQELVIRSGLLKTTLTISPSKSLTSPKSYFYLHGLLEYYLSDKLSVSGEGYLYQGMISGKNADFVSNHSLFWGFSRHLTKGDLDFYVGIQPGLSFTRVAYTDPILFNVSSQPKLGVNPSFSTVAGLNYYMGKYLHVFIQSRLVLAEHNTEFVRNISDLRFSAGLGFNFNAIR